MNGIQPWKVRNFILLLLSITILSCHSQVNDTSTTNAAAVQAAVVTPLPLFEQIHTNLNGMVMEFVRSMYQDTKGNYWFGTNGNGIIKYDGRTLEKVVIDALPNWLAVRRIIEDKKGTIWFATSSGLVKYDGKNYSVYSVKEGLQNEEIWSLSIDKKGTMWVGTTHGASHFDGKKFIPFAIPETVVADAGPMLSIKSVGGFVEDNDGTLWIGNDGNGIFTYKNGKFKHLTKENGLTDNHAGVSLKDSQGNLWISSFYGGVSKYDGKRFTNFTQDGLIKGEETGSFCEDRNGHIWFTAEGLGVYRYDGSHFTLYTTENGLTTNVVQCIMEDNKGQLWFSSWQGLCIFDGEKFVDAKEKEPWTK